MKEIQYLYAIPNVAWKYDGSRVVIVSEEILKLKYLMFDYVFSEFFFLAFDQRFCIFRYTLLALAVVTLHGFLCLFQYSIDSS